MEQNTANNVVAIENVIFTDPDENIRKAMRREGRKTNAGCAFLLIGFAAVFSLIAVFWDDAPFDLTGVIIASLFAIPFIIRVFCPSKFQVCYGTVFQYFRTSDTDYSYDHVSIRLDGTGEEVRGLQVGIHGKSSEIEGKHVMLCRYGKKPRQYRYVVYPTDTPEMMERTSDHGCG